MPFEPELRVARDAAEEASRIIARHYEHGTETWEKAEDDPVTLADLEADRAITRRIAAAFPRDAILSEETATTRAGARGGRVWIVDPMDGTKEFTRRIPEFGVSIALVEGGSPVVGVIDNPVAGVQVWASRGGGCWRDGERVRVTTCSRLEDAVLVASRSELSRDAFAAYEGWFEEIRPMGSIAWKLACIASGDGDLNVSLAPKNEWDVCAGDLLVREAGGAYLDPTGRARRYDQPDTKVPAGMAAGHRPLVEAFFERNRHRQQ
ncbi:MAG: 3'(2'),5'-bisphosphate nucleotidase CysQ [Myxococcota bacterium]|nr:3'(2'),5'-bisphosphate nucleotidase CysQ [Myxococcota bacterium]